MAIKDLTGQRFGRLTVLNLDKTENRKSYWRCQCDCGNQVIVRSDCLKSGTGRPCTVSCGCYNREKNTAYIDGRCKTKLYHVYYGILQRCNNPREKHYNDYGGRGIQCLFQNWEQFRDWSLNNGYQEGLSIDRINNDGNYSPENCRWTTQAVQNSNKRPRSTDIFVEYEGQRVNLAHASKLSGIKYGTLYYRYKRNQPLFTSSE